MKRAVAVEWGSHSLILSLAPEKPDARGAPRWRGHLGSITVEEQRDIHGQPMVLASVAVPWMLDPGDAYVHTLDSGWQSDAAAAVAELYKRTELVRLWLDELLSATPTVTGEYPA